MRTFKSEDKFFLSSRNGWVYTMGPNQLPVDLYDPCLMVGETVEIDGVEYVVKGVETFCTPRSPSSPYRGGFGILT